MKTEIAATGIAGLIAFICSYLQILVMENAEQFLAVISVMFLDGIFGIIAGTKIEGFKTKKAISLLRNTAVWVVILATLMAHSVLQQKDYLKSADAPSQNVVEYPMPSPDISGSSAQTPLLPSVPDDPPSSLTLPNAVCTSESETQKPKQRSRKRLSVSFSSETPVSLTTPNNTH